MNRETDGGAFTHELNGQHRGSCDIQPWVNDWGCRRVVSLKYKDIIECTVFQVVLRRSHNAGAGTVQGGQWE